MRQLPVKIPPGADNGTVWGIRREGEPSESGGPPGDLRVVISVRPHPIFQRNGDTIIVELPITLCEAALGTQVDVPTIDGKVKLKIPAGHKAVEPSPFEVKVHPNCQMVDAGTNMSESL